MAIDLGKQVGPLPLGAWIVVVGAGIGIMLWQRQTSTGVEEPQEDTGAPEGVGEGGGPGWIDLNPPQPNPQTDPEITDNAAWLTIASNGLIGLGFPADVVVAALNKGINGQQMTVQEGAIWRLALTRYGVPPEGIMPGPTPPPVPPPNPGPQPSPTQPPRVLGVFVDPFSITRTSAVIRWAGHRNWWNYEVWRMLNGRPSRVAKVTASSGNVPLVSYEMKGLKPNTAYTQIFVIAVNAAGKQSPWSNQVSFRTKR